MSRELEIVGLAAADGLVGPRPTAPGAGPKHAVAHSECLNCGAALHGRFCAACGQAGDDHHRSILHLVWEWVQDLTHLDGRLAKTLPPLFLAPGRLARDHFEGRRQRHVPPLRLFFVSLLLFMLVLEGVMHGGRPHKSRPTSAEVPVELGGPKMLGATTRIKAADGRTVTVSVPSAAQISAWTGGRVSAAEIEAQARRGAGLTPPPTPPTPAASPPAGSLSKPGAEDLTSPAAQAEAAADKLEIERDAAEAKAALPRTARELANDAKMNSIGAWFRERVDKAQANPEYYKSLAFEWAHRLAILLLPIFAGLLSLLYVYKREFYVYDHLVVAMHFLSFVFLVSALAYLLPGPLRGWAVAAATLWTPVNLFMTLRGAYGSGVVGAGIKTLVLWSATVTLFSLLLAGILVLALGQL